MGEDKAGPGTSPPQAPIRRRRGDQSPRALIDAVFPVADDADASHTAALRQDAETASGRADADRTRAGGDGALAAKPDAASHHDVDARTRPPSPMPRAKRGTGAEQPDDLQVVAQHALHAMCEGLGLDVGLILKRDAEGLDSTAIASFARTGDPRPPEIGELALLWRQTRASDLGDPTLPEVARLFSQRTGFTAVRALSPGSRSAGPGLLLLVGGADDRLGRVRPRTLARLESMAASLDAPLERDRTASRMSEFDDAVKRLDRLALLGSLVAEVIHEVRNPLVSIKTFLELIPQRLDDPEFHGDFRGLVLDEVFRLERLLDEVLAHARPGPVGERPVDAHVGEALSGLEQLLAHRAREAGVTLEAVAVEADFGAAALSPDALRQALLNLCVNAIEACTEGGAVRVSARRREGGRRGEHVEIWVEDDGPGIADADRELVFEPFQSSRSDTPGGLGLAISRRLAEEAGGRLFVAQATGGGARFVLRLPSAS